MPPEGQRDHPGMANYPADDSDYRRSRRPPPMPSANRYLPPLGEQHQRGRSGPPPPPRGASNGERITVTRAAAMRSREMGSRMYSMVQRAATADGADKSGLTALTWPVVANFAVDSAMAVALANTLFFAAASGESKSKVALYLLITIAPFAVIAPLIGPALDKLQHGRRVALALSFALRTVLALVLIMNYDGASGSFPSWVLYPCALAMMVFSKSFSVLRSAVTPRVMPPTIDLVRVNSRLTMFGLLGGTIAGGAVAAGVEFGCTHLFKLPGALFVVVGITIAGALLSMRIPRWVEVTTGEVPATLSYHRDSGPLRRSWPDEAKKVGGTLRQPLGRNIITSLWGNCTIKVMVGFLFLYPAFVAKAHDADGWVQLAMLGIIGAAAGIGNFAGNFASARLQLGRPAGQAGRPGGAVHRGGDRVRIGRRGGRQPGRGRRRHPDHLRIERHRQGLAGRLLARRPAGGVARLGVRAFGVDVAAGVGPGWRGRGVGVHGIVGGFHRRERPANPRVGPDHRQLPG
ncbi:hypothetical protein MKUB_43320 [Mycobacterium kubicae]|uniref:MFS transporter n=1 Tax=Mycobacterium kubicae TaxID=120959 RepID=A0ABQ1BTA4_9MYCO|nr:hypothetical protein MKUB_43320 [Mycobacterium kubicae]